MTDDIGLFEHALFRSPRTEHGYCVDDVARALIVLCRDGWGSTDGYGVGATDGWGADGNPDAHGPGHVARPGHDGVDPVADRPELARRYARFIQTAQLPDGRVVNRRDVNGIRQGTPGVQDCWGRAVWALGTAAARGRDEGLTDWAATRFDVSAGQRSPWPRAMAFAGLGAAEMMRVDPSHRQARSLLVDAAAAVGTCGGGLWPWPEPRLTYANAVLPDVLMAAGDCLHEDRLIDQGLQLLDWLVTLQTTDGHLSLIPAGGWGEGEERLRFDQQPIEAATLAEACARAFDLTGDTRWSDAVEASAAWFFGRNDASIPLYDATTGGCCDGLEAHGRNENQGAESTLAMIATVQHASRLLRPTR